MKALDEGDDSHSVSMPMADFSTTPEMVDTLTSTTYPQ
jgi:hypothetical protein